MSTTLNPTDTTLNGAVVSNSNRTVNRTTGTSLAHVHSVDAITGKVYWQAVLDAKGSNAFFRVGFAIAGGPTTNDLGATADGVGWETGGAVTANYNSNFTPIGTAVTWGSATGQVLSIAVDVPNKLCWFRLGSGNWNNSGTANPATGAGGFSWASSGVTAGALYACLQLYNPTDQYTCNFATASWTIGAPSGFGEINSSTNASATGSTVTDTASIVAGTPSAGVSLNGTTITATASIVAGTANAGTGAGATGATITDTASIIAGTPSASVPAPGSTITVNASIVAGSVHIDAVPAGVTLTATASIIPGTASTGSQDASANGAIIVVLSSIVAGHAYIGARALTNQELRQAAARLVTSTTLDYNGDWEALFDAAGISKALDWNGRMLAWINGKLTANYIDLPDAMTAFAIANGAPSWSSMGTFS